MEEDIDRSEGAYAEMTEEEERQYVRLVDELIIEDLSVEDLKVAYCRYGEWILSKLEKALRVTDGFKNEAIAEAVSRHVLMYAEKRYLAGRELARRGVAYETKVTIETKEDKKLSRNDKRRFCIAEAAFV